MTEQRNDGGPAFPVNYSNERDGPTVMPTPGMTLRDYFAAKALAGMIAEPQWREGSHSLVYEIGPKTHDDATNYAFAAFKLADAMLKARDA